jgi:hypothetical protein
VLFSEGGCSRDGIASTDTVNLPRERNEVIKLREFDTRRCLEEFRKRGNGRVERLKEGADVMSLSN